MYLILIFCASILGKSDALKVEDIEAWRWSTSLDDNLTLTTTVDRTFKNLAFSLKLNVTTSINLLHGVRVGISPEPKISNGSHYVEAWETTRENSTLNGTWTEYFTVNGTNIAKNESQTDWTVLLQSVYPDDDTTKWYAIDVLLDRSFGVNTNNTDLGREIKNENIYLIWGYGLRNESDSTSTLMNVTEGSMEINLLKFPVSGSSTTSQSVTSILLYGIAFITYYYFQLL